MTIRSYIVPCGIYLTQEIVHSKVTPICVTLDKKSYSMWTVFNSIVNYSVLCRLAICLSRQNRSVFASYGNLAHGKGDSFYLVPAKRSLAQCNADSCQHSLLIHGPLNQPGFKCDRYRQTSMHSAYRIPRDCRKIQRCLFATEKPSSPSRASFVGTYGSLLCKIAYSVGQAQSVKLRCLHQTMKNTSFLFRCISGV